MIKDFLRTTDRKFDNDFYEMFEKFLLSISLKYYRKKRRLTQRMLAKLAGLTQLTVSRVESYTYKNYTIPTLRKIAKAINLELVIYFKEKLKEEVVEVDSWCFESQTTPEENTTTDFLKTLHKKLDSKAYESEKFRLVVSLKYYRKKRGLTQSKLAELIGSSNAVISRIESLKNEYYPIQILRRIAKVLNLELVIYFREKSV